MRNLRSIVDVVKTKGYGIGKISRHRSLPSSRSGKHMGTEVGTITSQDIASEGDEMSPMRKN